MRRSIQLPLRPRTWGGARAGAGRPAGARRRVPHRRRPPHEARYPVHGTLRVRAALPSLRGAGVFRAVSDALAVSSRRGFRVIEFSVQSNHIHLLVEADDRTRLSRGLQGLKIRIARAVNGTLHRRGTFWAERYHARALATPREVRNALVCAEKRAQARHVRPRIRSMLVGGMVHGVEMLSASARPSGTGRAAADVARVGRVAPIWAHRKRGRTGPAGRVARRVSREHRGPRAALLPASPPRAMSHTRRLPGSRRARSASSTRFTGTGTPARAAARTTAPLRASCSRRRPRR